MEPKVESGTYPVLPGRSQPCVWMVAGLLRYHLCDLEYDCEHCPLDAAMHGARAASPPAPSEPREEPWERIREGLRYHPLHGWVAESDGGRIRWGIDGVTALFLDRISAVVLPAVGTELAQGKAACWLMDDGELFPLRSPVTGSVALTNPALRGNPTLVSHAPYDAGWLIEIEAGGGSASQPGLCDAAERRAGALRQLQRLQHAAASRLRPPVPVGPTAQDGGAPLTELRRMLGRARYHRLVFSLLR
jgi:glycine cleavage system H protein